jgi:hypothetical protein
VAGDSSSFFVQLRDLFGNNITQLPNNETDFQITFIDNSTGEAVLPSSIAVQYLQNGTYAISYNMTLSNQYVLVVAINGTAINQSPFDCIVVPGWQLKDINSRLQSRCVSSKLRGQTRRWAIRFIRFERELSVLNVIRRDCWQV